MAGATIFAGSGLSGHADSLRGAEEAARAAVSRMSGGPADWVVVFATVHHFSAFRRMMEIISRETGTPTLIGCSGYGVLTDEGEIEGAPGIAVLAVSSSSVQAYPFIERPLHSRPEDAGVAIAEEVSPRLVSNASLILLPDTYHLDSKPFLAALGEELGGDVPMVGGGASEDGSQGRTYQFFGTQIESNAVVGMLLAGSASMEVRMTQACRPLGKTWVVTRAERNIVYELGGRPAFEVFEETAGEERMRDVRTAVLSVFTGLPMDPDQEQIERGQYLVRNIIGVDPESGAIAVSEEVRSGQILTFTVREPLGARDDLLRMAAGLKAERPSVSFGLYFNCMARGRGLYGEPGVDTRTLRDALRGAPMAGFFTGAEIAPNCGKTFLHQYSGVLLLVSG